MRLLFNASNLRSEGGVVLLEHLLKEFLAQEPTMHIVLYLNPELVERVQSTLGVQPQIEWVPFHPGSGWKRLYWEQITLPRIIRQRKIDTLFSFGNTGPCFPGCRQILYAQQSIPYTNFVPEQHTLQWRFFQMLYGFLIGLAQCGSTRMIIPTSWLKEPMRRSIFNGQPQHKYHVTLPGIPKLPEFSSGFQFTPHELSVLEQLEQAHANHEKILFYPCYLAPYKHIPYLLETLKILEARKPPPYRLLLTIDAQSREYFPCRAYVFDALKTLPRKRVMLTGSLSRQAIAEMYRKTHVLVFPSLVETLGLPLLEALSHGIPIVATQSESPKARQAAFAREICRDAALYADPKKPEEFAEQLEKLLHDETLCHTLSQAGLVRASELSWPAHVQAILSSDD